MGWKPVGGQAIICKGGQMNAPARDRISKGAMKRYFAARQRPPVLSASPGAFVCAFALLMLLAPVSVGAFAIYPDSARWFYDYNHVPCGPSSAGVWNPCQVSFTYDASVTVRPGWAQTATQAASQWRTVEANGLLDFNYTYFDYSNDIVRANVLPAQVRMVAIDLGPPDNVGNALLGRTALTRNPGTNALSSASIEMNNNPGVAWCTVLDSGCPDASHIALQTATIHELGHALGLTHPVVGSFSGVVMECKIGYGENQLVGPDDRNGALYHYGSLSNGPAGATVSCAQGA